MGDTLLPPGRRRYVLRRMQMTKWLKIAGITGAVLLVGALILGGATLAFARGAFHGGVPFAGRGGFDAPGGDWHMDAGRRGGPDGFMEIPGFEGRGGPGHRGGPGGEVTAIDGKTLTVTTPASTTLTVVVSDTTRIMLAETQSEGTLTDISVGASIGVRGRPDADGVVQAVDIVVLPAGDRAGGRVTAVNGQTISVENPRSGDTATIVTNDETTFRLGRDGEGSLVDVTADRFVMAYGSTQADGSLAARLVMLADAGKPAPPGPGRPGPRQGAAAGEVTGIDGSTFTVDTFWGETDTIVQTDDTTQYRNRSGDELTFADIKVGGMVFVKGRPVDGAENTIQAEIIGIKQ